MKHLLVIFAFVTLVWSAPTRNTDGTALTNLAGYMILYRPAASSTWKYRKVANPATTRTTIRNLAPGTWTFCMKSYNNVGVRSACTPTVTATL